MSHGKNIDQDILTHQIDSANEELTLPSGAGLRVHFDTQTNDLSIMLPFIKKIRNILSEEISDENISVSTGGMIYPPRDGNPEGSPKVYINIYRRVEE